MCTLETAPKHSRQFSRRGPSPSWRSWATVLSGKWPPAEGAEGADGWIDLDIIVTADKRINRECSIQAFLLKIKLAI